MNVGVNYMREHMPSDARVHYALLDTGEWAPLGQAPDGQPWQLGLADPRHSARLLRSPAARLIPAQAAPHMATQ